MLVTVVGTSTPYGYWGFSLTGHILDVVYGAHRHIHCLDVEGLRAGWSEDKDKPVVVSSDRPDTALSYLLITSSYPVLAFLDTPRDALAKAVIFDGLSLLDAVRFCTQYFSCLAGCTGSDHVRQFGGDWAHAKPMPNRRTSRFIGCHVGSMWPAACAASMSPLAWARAAKAN